MAERTKRQLATDDTTPHYLDDQAKKALTNRLARLEGHIRFIRGMVQEHRCADEILLQVAAVKAALNKFSAALLDHELKACMNSCMQGDADEGLDKVTNFRRSQVGSQES